MSEVHKRAAELLERELERFRREHPRSGELSQRASTSLLAGVPMHWMLRWPGAYPVYAAEAAGARFRDVDGHEYVDFCLGDTGAMTGHSPERGWSRSKRTSSRSSSSPARACTSITGARAASRRRRRTSRR